jgi:hypothetical protein
VRLLTTLVTVAVLALTAGCGAQQAAETPRGPATVTITASPTDQSSPSTAPSPAPTAATTPSTAPTKQTPTKQTPTKHAPAPVDLSRYDMPGFTTPSGNIGCQFDHLRGPHIRCDRLQMTSVPGGKPADCDFDWGHSVELFTRDHGSLACTSDSVMGQPGETDGTRALPYGDSVRYRGIVCTSTRKGLRCTTTGGGGFLLSRETIRVS